MEQSSEAALAYRHPPRQLRQVDQFAGRRLSRLRLPLSSVCLCDGLLRKHARRRPTDSTGKQRAKGGGGRSSSPIARPQNEARVCGSDDAHPSSPTSRRRPARPPAWRGLCSPSASSRPNPLPVTGVVTTDGLTAGVENDVDRYVMRSRPARVAPDALPARRPPPRRPPRRARPPTPGRAVSTSPGISACITARPAGGPALPGGRGRTAGSASVVVARPTGHGDELGQGANPPS